MKAIFVPRPDPLPDPAPTETVQRNGRTNPALSASPPLSAELSAPTGDWSPEKRVGVLGSAKRHLGYRFGHRFASVSHTDRTTGRPRRSLVPVVNYDSFRREVLVISTSGKRAAWFRDVRKDPNVEVAIGGIRFPAKATRLGPTEANEALKAFERRGAFARSARRRLSALVGQPYDGSALDRERLAREVRIVAFRIDDRPRGSGPVRPTARSQAVEPTPKPISGTREFGSTP
jgi:deazaflavin-dependent oxidoreductase (nitroreductase family)